MYLCFNAASSTSDRIFLSDRGGARVPWRIPSKRLIDAVQNAWKEEGGTTAGASPGAVGFATGTTGGGQYLTSASTFTSSVSTTQACNPSTNYISYQTSARTRNYSARIVGPGTVSGVVTSTIGTSNSTFPCANFAETVDSISLSNITLVNQSVCESINNSVQPIVFTNFRQSTVLNSPSGGNVIVGG